MILPEILHLSPAKSTLFSETRVLVWRLEEEASQLVELCREADIPVEDLIGIPPKRQREKAAERLLLAHAMGQPAILSHTDQGAPLIEGAGLNISITHTRGLVAMALDDKRVIGLDAETIDRPQVIRVRDKFLNAIEQQFIAADDLTAHVIAWTAKEAIIKAERNSAIDWTNGICLEPFIPSPVETNLTASCGDNRYRLATRLFEGHCITLAVPATSNPEAAVQ